MKKKVFTIADYLFVRLKQIGVDHLFGVVGDFSLGLVKRVYKSKVKMVCTCNELNAAYAADGYARVHGVGAIVSTYVVGELSALNGIAGALAENVPVIKITGCPAIKHYHSRTLLHHTLGDYDIPLRIYREITVAAEVLKDPATACNEIDRVLQACLLHRKPVYLGVPADIVVTECGRPSQPLITPSKDPCPPEILEEALKEASSLLKKAKRPLVLADFSVDRFRLQKDLEHLLKKSGYPFATLMLSKTVLDESHPQYIGTYAGSRSRAEVRKRVEQSDGILALGLKLTDFNSGGFSINFSPEKTVYASPCEIKIKQHIFKGINLKDFIQGIASRLPHKSPASFDFKKAHDLPAFKKALSYKPSPSKRLTLQRFFERMVTFLDRNSIGIFETGSSLFAGAEMVFQKGARFMSQTFYGSIGYTVGAALGTAIGASPKRTVLFVGDGSFQLTCQEISTMIRYKLNPIIFLINNDGYLVERVIGDGPFNDIQRWNYAKIPETFGGGWGIKIRTEGELETALQKAKKSPSLSFIEVIIDKWDSPPAMTKAGAAMAKTNFISD